MNETANPLTPPRIVEAALGIADRDGLAAVSMRKLGKVLGVEAMAMYYHYKSKQELVEAMLDTVHAEITTPPEDTQWRTFMKIRAQSVLEVVMRHKWAASVMESGIAPGPATLHDREAIARCLRQAGFSIAATVRATTLLDIYIYGFAAQYANLSFTDSRQAAELTESVVGQFQQDSYPFLTELFTDHIMAGHYDPMAEFDFGLEVVLDGIEHLKC